MRRLFALLVFSAIAPPLLAQAPSQQTLDGLGLKSEWVSAVPLAGARDGIATVQVANHRQIFVQTRSGLLAAFDAATGERLWSFRYDSPVATPQPVCWNDRHVFALNVTKLHGIQRVNGVVDFTQGLPQAPTAPPVADAERVYVIMAGNRLACMMLPPGLLMPDAELLKVANKVNPNDARNKPGLMNPADVVANRYPPSTRNLTDQPEMFERRKVNLTSEPTGSFGTHQTTASLSVVATLRPPFRAFDDGGGYLNSTPSIGLVSSLRQPYHLQDPTAKNTQRTPSISVIPPSLFSVHELANLRPRGIELETRWTFGSTVPLHYSPLLTEARIWGITNTPVIVAIDRLDGATDIDARLSAAPTAPSAQAEDIGYVPQADGYLVAIDLAGGATNQARVLWRANVNGLMNAAPVPMKDAVFQPGSNAGILRIDRTTGDVVWRSELASDRLLAVNDEHVYARDSHGKLFVYDRNRVSDTTTLRAYPQAVADLGSLNVTVTNHETDRIYLASDSGLFLCLRDSNPKYAKIQTIAPPRSVVKAKTGAPAPAPKVEAMPKP